MRALADDPEAQAPPPTSGCDPRIRHAEASHGHRALATRAAAAVPVPALVVETPASGTPAPDRRALVAGFPAGATLVELDDDTPEAAAPVITAWASSLTTGTTGAGPPV
jgi:hypothetical protein